MTIDEAYVWYRDTPNALSELLEMNCEHEMIVKENKELRSLLSAYYNAPCFNCEPWSDSWGGCTYSDCGNCMLAKKAVELGISERE